MGTEKKTGWEKLRGQKKGKWRVRWASLAAIRERGTPCLWRGRAPKKRVRWTALLSWAFNVEYIPRKARIIPCGQ